MSKNEVSDGYHTFGELYEHRAALFIALCKQLQGKLPVWRSELHHDGSLFEDVFIMGIGKEPGKQMSYHLGTVEWWGKTAFAETLEKAPEWDGHNSADVLARLLLL